MKYKRRIQICVITALTILSFSSTVWAATYYVSGATGSDGNPGTLSSPWKTIAKASSVLQSGDTVLIRKGTYKEMIKPARSGVAGKYITYARYNAEEAIITGVYDGVDLRGRSYIILDGLKVLNVGHYWVNMRESSTHNIIRNCYMKTALGWGGIQMENGSNYNKILKNTFISTCDGTDGGPHDSIYCWNCSHNLIEDNDFQYSTHICLLLGGTSSGYHIVRNNRFRNPWHTCFAINEFVEHCLIEGNMFLDAGSDYKNNWCGSDRDRLQFAREDHRSIQLNGANCIIRNNILMNNGTFMVAAYEAGGKAAYNRIYNNTSYKNYRGCWLRSDSAYGNVLKNNIFDEDILCGVDSTSGNSIINNNFHNCLTRGGTQSDNTKVDSQFEDPYNKDFNLRSTSSLIDAGAFLTQTTSSGSGVDIPVKDASYFTNGWGVAKGDLVQLQGQTETARIIAIKDNVIVVDKPLTWMRDVGVSLAYSGPAPDVGAVEYAFDPAHVQLEAPKNLRIN